MRKLLLALFALALVVAFTAPSHAADFKMTGLYQVRGTTNNANADGDDDADDKDNYLEALIRPRFTATSGAVKAVWEPEFASAHGGFSNAGRQAVGVNRWVIDFAIPGKFAPHGLGPGGSLLAGQGKSTTAAVGPASRVSQSTANSARTCRSACSTPRRKKIRTPPTMMMKITTPVCPSRCPPLSRFLRGRPTRGAYTIKICRTTNYSFLGLHAKSKMGIISINATVVGQDGEVDTGVDLSAWAVLVRTSASFGRLKLEGNLTMLSGDDGSNTGETGKFHFPQLGGFRLAPWLSHHEFAPLG